MADAYTCDFCGKLMRAEERMALKIIAKKRSVGFSYVDVCADCDRALNDLARKLRNEVTEDV